MSNGKMFSENFRLEVFNEFKLLGHKIENQLIGIVQNPMSLSDSDLEIFNSEIDSVISQLSMLKTKVCDEYSSNRLVPFEE